MSAPATESVPLRRTPLDGLHRELGARMGAFAGWDMPIQYPEGLRAEHLHVRAACGLFDVSHMGQIAVSSVDPAEASDTDAIGLSLSRALPIDTIDWSDGRQRYSLLLDDAGGIADDLMVLRLEEGWRLIVNAGNRDADIARLRRLCPELRFDFIDAALLALQGPQAEEVLAAFDPRARDMAFMDGATLMIEGAACVATRSGYTGEDGWEISVPRQDATRIARRLLADPRVRPAGLGARDTLRLEAGLPLHGNDIGPEVTPAEAALAWAIPKSRRAGGEQEGCFPGASRVLAQLAGADGAPPVEPPARRLVGLTSAGNVPIRAGAEILDVQGEVVGRVTSGTVSPTLGRPVMLALLDRRALPGKEAPAPALVAAVRQQRPPVEVTSLPFVPKRYRR